MRHKVTIYLLYKRTSMNIINSLQTGLLLHLIGLTLLVGATLSSYIVQRQFRKEYKDQQKGLALMQSSKKLRHLAAIGLGLQVVSGVMMLAATGGGYGQQLWFKIKMVLVLLIIAVTIAWNRSLQNRLHQLVQVSHGHSQSLWRMFSMTAGGSSEQLRFHSPVVGRGSAAAG